MKSAAPFASLFLCLLVAPALGGCANRGMKADTGVADRGSMGDDHTVADAADAGIDAMADDTPAVDAAPDLSPPTDAPADVAPDAPAGDARDAAPDGPRDMGRADAGCSARFNFENGATYMASNNNACSSCPKGFTAVVNSGAKTFCGNGALEVTAAFVAAPTGPTIGEIVIPLNGAGEDLTNKTLTVSVAAVPSGGTDLVFKVRLGTSAGVQTALTFSSVSDTFATASVVLSPGDGGLAGLGSVSQLTLQATSTLGYAGKIYVDELDIR